MPIVCYDCPFCQITLEASMKQGDDWIAYSVDTDEADVLRQSAVKLGVPEKCVEMLRTGGCWLARERQEKTE